MSQQLSRPVQRRSQVPFVPPPEKSAELVGLFDQSLRDRQPHEETA
jgi:hypothetical protein